MIGAVLVVVGYICGSFPTALIVTRLATGEDIRAQGSGNPGAANVARNAGFKVGIAVAVVDILKGAVPVWIGMALHISHPWLALTAVAAVLGHDFSFLLRGRGGKGVATTLGVALALSPLAAVGALLVWVGVFAATRYSSLASLIALAILPVLVWLAGSPREYIWAAIVLLAIAAVKHHENISRLLQGDERKFSRARSTSGG